MIYFGTKTNMQWVSDYVVDVDAQKSGWSARADFTGGGSWVRRSKVAAKQYNLSWNMKTREELQPILDYADGVYGDGYIYFNNPMWMDKNVLPSYWANPSQNYYDGPVVVNGVRPTLVQNPSSTNGYPTEYAVYNLTSSMVSPSIFIPIPPGYTAHVGVHGVLDSGSSGRVQVTPEINALQSGPSQDMGFISATSTTRTNAQFSGDQYLGITLSFRSSSSGTIIIYGIIVQILPNGKTPERGGFINGQGQSGMQFETFPKVTEYSAGLGLVGMSAKLVETEAWAQ